MNTHIDADVAHALVNYVERKPDDLRNWGMISATDVRTFICRNTTGTNTINTASLHNYLSNNESAKMSALANSKSLQFRELLRRVRKFNK